MRISPSQYFSDIHSRESGAKSPSVPTEMFIVKGEGQSNHSFLNAFDKSLMNAGIGHLNLIQYSSILPHPIQFYDQPFSIQPGSQTGVILSKMSGKQGETISAGLIVGKAEGYSVVYEGTGKSKEDLNKFLVSSITEALNARGILNPNFFLESCQMEVTDKFGSIIVAIVFNPKTFV